MISLINHDFQWSRSEVVIIYPHTYIYIYKKRHRPKSSILNRHVPHQIAILIHFGGYSPFRNRLTCRFPVRVLLWTLPIDMPILCWYSVDPTPDFCVCAQILIGLIFTKVPLVLSGTPCSGSPGREDLEETMHFPCQIWRVSPFQVWNIQSSSPAARPWKLLIWAAAKPSGIPWGRWLRKGFPAHRWWWVSAIHNHRPSTLDKLRTNHQPTTYIDLSQIPIYFAKCLMVSLSNLWSNPVPPAVYIHHCLTWLGRQQIAERPQIQVILLRCSS